MKCHHCHGEMPESPGRIRLYCGPECKSAAAWAKRKARMTPADHQAQYRRSTRYRAASRKQQQAATCLECGDKSVARSLCPRHYRQLRKREGAIWASVSDHASRARRAGVRYVLISKLEIFDRDGWICQLCREPVNPDLVFPDPGSPSLDHVVPLARGGDHVPTNVQLAHMGCNGSKGDGGIRDYVDPVLELSEAGLSRPAIAEQLGVSVRTVAWIRQRYRLAA